MKKNAIIGELLGAVAKLSHQINCYTTQYYVEIKYDCNTLEVLVIGINVSRLRRMKQSNVNLLNMKESVNGLKSIIADLSIILSEEGVI